MFVNHLRSLIGVDTNDASGDFVRRKRQAGAEALATFISQNQTAGENVISVGDYNAFEVNDGYVDVLGTIKGQPTTSDKVLMASADLVDPDLIDLATTKPGSYSYVESGNAQTLDHIVVTSSLTGGSYHLEAAHINADFPKTYANDATRPERVSDHDPVVGYFTLPSATPVPAVTLSASNLDFGDQVINATSAAKIITLTNSGTAALGITNIAASAEFSEANDCPTSLGSNASCTITVAFAPLSTGAKTGAVTITDDANGSPHSVALTGNGTPVLAPGIGLSAASLDFGAQTITTTSSSKTVTITNTGTADLAISGIVKTDANSDFTSTHNCPASLSKGLTCTITVTFAPKAAGAKTATVTITHSAAGSPHTVTLAGTGTDFAVAPPTGGSASATVNAGQTATFNLQIAGSASFSGNAALSCSGAPDKATCAVSSPSATLSGTTPVSFTTTVTTTAPTTTTAGFQSTPGPRSGVPFIFALALVGLGAIVVVSGSGKKRFRFAGACAALLMAVALSSCGGSSKTTQTIAGTPSGTYTVTVTATANGVTRTLPLTLKVN